MRSGGSTSISTAIRLISRCGVRSGSTGDTKTQKSRRTLALPSFPVDRLRAHRARQAEERLKVESWGDPGLVFPTRVGTRMDAAGVRRDFRRPLKVVPGDRAEGLDSARAAALVRLAAVGLGRVSVEDIADLVGHKGTQVTELVYRHQLKPVIQTGATAMDALFPLDWIEGPKDA